ncbi:MAG TPA: nitrilase-related carbon-nitrogen hydrolase [Mycobacteriales bacterium]|nr:nitrilase-related carbon-nitrogen hydrolase [Mycobacteriales bacterium]
MTLAEDNATAPTPTAASEARPPERTVLRIVGGLLLSALSGVLAGVSFEGFHIWPFIWFAFVPALVAQYHVLPRRWSGLGLGVAVGIMFQIYLGPGLADGDVGWYLKIYGFWIAIIVALLVGRSRSFQERTDYRWFLISGPLAWVALDFLRTTATEVAGGTWGMVAYAMYDRPGFLQPVSVFGIHGLNLLILLSNWALGGLVLAKLQHRRPAWSPVAIPWRRAVAWFGVVAMLVVAWGVSSEAMIRHPAATVRVAAIQPGSWTQSRGTITPAVELQHDIAQTRQAAAEGAKLIVWREAGLKFDPTTSPRGAVIAHLARSTHTYIAAGWYAVENGKRLNEVATFAPNGKLLGTYGKTHPGTFAGDYSDWRGHYIVYRAPFGSFGSIICFDLDFLDSARAVAKLGAQIIAVSSNDVQGIADKHYTHLVFRAIETRMSAVKADSTYDSAAIDPYGRILDRHVTRDGSAYTLVADVPLGSGKTFYVKHGDWLGWLAVIAAAAFALLSVATRLRRRRVGAAGSSGG